ncbi:WD40 repeat domain-containing protein [Actinocrispum wychmicini]|uniref:WD domain G-beta repeat uncharacterized protein n=1 Tax=Actinocrispum wychmicini TaxID=1213861 RepID=A0A4R2JHZ8_9PSEU|nr:hypothetical protein [Actinocrispum wychmicini]TCO56626.1 WD domain G-beta repeat uncharacterized protein [Actinocrispum wychmicini]
MILETYRGDAGNGLALHPDGDRFVSAGGNVISVWSRRQGERLGRIGTDLAGGIYRLAIMGEHVFAGCLSDGDEYDGRVLELDLASGEVITAYQPELDAPTGYFVVSADHVVSAGSESLHLWDIGSARPRWSLKGQYSIAGLHGDTVVAWTPGVMEVRTAADGAPIRSFEVDAEDFGYVTPVFLADGRSLWTFESDSFAVIDHEAGAVLRWSPEHDGEITSISVSADESRILTSSQDGTFRVWDASTFEYTEVRVGDIAWSARFVDGDQHVLVATSEDRLEVRSLP